MAYGIKYKLDFCNPDGMLLRYEILKRDYTGTQFNVEGTGTPIVFSGSGKEENSALITTEAIIQIREDANFKVEDIYTSDEKEYQVKYYENNILEWMGYLLPDFFDREISGHPVVELTAVDHLGMLKGIPYQNINGKPYQGRMSFMRLLINCIKHIDIDLNLKIMVDLVCDEWDPIRPEEPYRQLHFFKDTYHESSRFSDDRGNVVSVHDVLETTLNLCNASIYIEGGCFWIVNRRQVELGMGNVFTYDLQGNQIGLSVPYSPKTTNIELVDVGGMQEVNPANSFTQIYSEHGPSFPTPKNNTFQGYGSGSYPSWTNRNGYQVEDTFVDVYRYNADGTIRDQGVTDVARPRIKSKVERSPFPFLQLKYNMQPYMETDPINMGSAESIAFNIGIKGHYNDPLIVILELKSYSAIGHNLTKTYFLKNSGDWAEQDSQKDEGYTENYLSFTLEKPEGRTSTTPWAVSGEFLISSNGLPRINRSEAVLELSVRVYGHTKGEDPDKYMMTIQSLSVDIKRNPEPSGILFSAINNDGHFTKKGEPLLTLFSDKIDGGDGRFSAITRDITSNLFTRSGKLTENWTGLV